MKKIVVSLAMLCMALNGRAVAENVCEGWPANYGGVMLQGFWWDSYTETTWKKLTDAAPELSQYFDLIWVPNSGTVTADPTATNQSKSMGYDPCWWLYHNSCFGTETELRTMINTYKDKGVGIIEDVVINHKKGVEDWCDFAQETVTGQNTGVTYSITWDNVNYSQICQTDDCNYFKDEQGNYPYHTTGANDTGDDFDGYRDLDHTNATTRANVKVYLDFLLDELGYAGFRYDMVKGYGAGYIQEYNNYSQPTYSVGEFWDNQTNIQNWIEGTGWTSAAFDFPLKFKMNDAISNGDYSAFDYKSFTYDPNYARHSVTFADNHDTGREASKLANNWSAANAFILASPGTPCVWYPHYNADPTNIRAMILARKACGITNTGCTVLQQYPVENNSGYILETQGTNGSVYVQLGSAADDGAPAGYTLVAEGDAYKFYSTQAGFASVKISPDGGAFTDETVEVTLTPVNATQGAWYTIGADATDVIPLTGETTITIGADYDVNEDITLFWGATGDDGVEYTGSTTFTKRVLYTPSVVGDEDCVFFETTAREVYIWAWDDKQSYTGESWETKPQMTLMGVNDADKLIYKYVFTTNGLPEKVLFVYGDEQTKDATFVNHGYYTESGFSHELGDNTLYYDNSISNWTNVYYYAWGASGAKAEWPGEIIEGVNADGYYEVTLDKAYTSIIFNDGTDGQVGVNQTEDLTAEDGTVYALTAYKVYFDNSQINWSKVYCYAYNEDDPQNVIKNAEWPGVEIFQNADGYYEAILTKNLKMVIFNDGVGGEVGKTQTENLTISDGEIYILEVSPEPEGSATVYFDNNGSNWANVYYYTWNEDGNAHEWPGEMLADCTDGIYKVTVPAKYTMIIFNNGSGGEGNQTANLEIEDGKVYDLYGSTFYTVYYNNTEGWDHVYYYVWNDNGSNGWPGKEITAKDYETASGGYYKAVVNSIYPNIIFNNNNGSQTKDLAVADGKIHKFSDEKGSEGTGYWPEDNSLFYPSSHNVDGINIVLNENGAYTCALLVLNDGKAFKNDADFTAYSVSYVRNISNGYKWGSIIMPFAVSSSDEVQYYTLKSVTSEKMVFTPVDEVTANTPAIYQLLNDELDYVEIYTDEVEVKATGEEPISIEPITDWTMCGTYENVSGLVSEGGKYIYFIAQDNFWLAEVAITVKPFRAWFETTSPLAAAKFRIEVEGEPEGIQTIEEERNSTEFVYDLMGRRSDVSRKGLLIKNGEIRFVK